MIKIGKWVVSNNECIITYLKMVKEQKELAAKGLEDGNEYINLEWNKIRMIDEIVYCINQDMSDDDLLKLKTILNNTIIAELLP